MIIITKSIKKIYNKYGVEGRVQLELSLSFPSFSLRVSYLFPSSDLLALCGS